MLLGETKMVTGSRSSPPAGTLSSVSPSSKYAMSVIAPTGSSIQCACTRAPPVLICSDESAATACSIVVSAPSSLISAHANGLSSGWPSSGSDCQVHD